MQPNSTVIEAGSSVQETQFAAITGQDEVAIGNSHDSTSDPQAVNLGSNGYASLDRKNGSKPRYGSIDAQQTESQAWVSTSKDDAKPAISPRALGPDLLRGLLMVLQAVDHCSVSQGAWRHGVALESEQDGTIVNEWNDPVPWTARMLTHLCAPGFMFLLGMGIVYFERSRSKLGWSAWHMVKHFAIRAFVLAAVNELLFTLPVFQGRILILNIVLLALAVNYLLAGLLLLAVKASEKALSALLDPPSNSSDDDAEQPLLQDGTNDVIPKSASTWAISYSWHIHNAILLALAIVTIAWNHWISPHHGSCPADTTPGYSGPTQPTSTSLGPWFDFWFLSVQYQRVISPFPPLAWLSPAILGLLYGRIILSQKWKAYTINASNALFGVFLMLLFILTRLLRFGNLSEDCLRMPEQIDASPERNQYLTSARAFFYIVKYPPSFAYVTFTMSVNFFFLAFFATLPENVGRRIPALLTFGQSALFFYIVHLMMYFLFGKLAKLWFGHELGYIDPTTGEQAVGTEGKPAVMWGTWVIGLAILWPLCAAYGRFKSTRGVNSVWRFF